MDEDGAEKYSTWFGVVEDPVVNEIYKASDVELVEMFEKKLESLGYDMSKVLKSVFYFYAPGKDDVAIVFHADTVFKKKPDRIIDVAGEWYADFDGENKSNGLGGDDRSGAYIAWRLLEMGHRPHVIITMEEETGCIGASIFADAVPKQDVSCLVEFDRHGGDEAVYYGCANKELEKFVTEHGFRTEEGRFSDIGYIAPAWGIGAVNLSIGVHGEHTILEHVVESEVEDIIANADLLLKDVKGKKFVYIEDPSYIPYLSRGRPIKTKVEKKRPWDDYYDSWL